MVTLKDIAQLAGVSVSTVSYVLNGHSKASAETQDKIHAAVKALRYVPNRTAASLRTKRSKNIGVLVPQFSTMFFVDVVNAIENVLYGNGYSMVLCTSHNDLRREQIGLNSLLSQQVAGLMITANDRCHDPISVKLDIPVLKMYESDLPEDHCIYVDNVVGGQLVGQHMIERQLYPAACIGYTTFPDTIMERVKSWQAYMAQQGHPVSEQLVLGLNDQTFEGGYSATKALLSRGIPFRSIFACTDMIALGVLKAFSEKGIRCPEDVAVISYDNTTFSQMSLPAMTTVDMQAKNLGKQGALMLLDMIDSKTLTKQKLMLYPKLVVRDST